jgi:hypothetical protein
VLWQIDVMGGVMLEAGAELKVVTGLGPENGTTGRFFPPAPRPGGEEDMVARRPSRRRASEP